MMSGREHELITAVAIRYPGGLIVETDVTKLRMRTLTREAIERYVASDCPFDCAGSYKLEAPESPCSELDRFGRPCMAITGPAADRPDHDPLRELGFDVP